MKKNPVLVLTGLAVAAVAGVAGLTRDQWMAPAPQAVSDAATTPAPEVAAPTPEQPVAAAEQNVPKVEAPAAPVAETTTTAPAAEAPAAAVAEAPAVEAAATPAPAAEAPATPAPAAEAPAPAVEAPATTVVTEQPPAAPEPVAEAPQPAPEQQQAAVTPPPEVPAAETAVAAAPETVPTFDTVRVEKTGEAVIAGTAEAGSEVVVMLDGQAIGKTVANTDGAFVVVPDQPLPAGSGALTIEAKAEGAATATASEQTVAVIVPEGPKKEALVALVSPNEPTRVLQKPQPQPEPEQQASAQPQDSAAKTPPAATAAPKRVSLDAVDYDTAGNIVFTGTGQPGHSARIYVDNSHSGDAKVGDDGRWAFAGNANMKAGVHALRVDGIDGSGKVLNRVEVPFFREETNKVAAAAPDQTVAATEQEQPQAQPKGPKDGRVVIQPGNNLWRISKVLYGTGTKFTLLYEANKDLIRDPDMIYPGQVFMTPDAVAPTGTIDPKQREPLKAEEEGAASAQ